MKELSRAGDAITYSLWDARFHRRIVDCSVNHIMTTVYSLIFESIYAHLCAMNREIGFDLGLSHHEIIYQAIAAGDANAAGECSVESIDDSISRARAFMPQE